MENNVYETPALKEEQLGQESETTAVSISDSADNTASAKDLAEGNSSGTAISTGQNDREENTEISSESDLQNVEMGANYDQNSIENCLDGKTRAEIIEIFEQLLSSQPVDSLKKDLELLKVAFYKESRQYFEGQKREFLAAGGVEEQFVAQTDDYEEQFKALFAQYRAKRDAFTKEQEDEKEQNLKIKLQIIEELKALISSSETTNTTFAAFRELQQRWKDSGSVPKANVKDVWETYHLHVENFYNYIKINNELRDLDLKKNYEAQTQICEEAEALLLEESVVAAFHALQKLHDRWREVGPVSAEYKDTLWDRFKNVSTKINKSHQDHFEAIKQEQLTNLSLKSELCTKCEQLLNGEFASKAAWDEASEKLLELQKVWKTIGFAPKKENTQIYAQFRATCDAFFDKKRNYFLTMKNELENNLQAKTALCVAAEQIAEREDWKKATEELLQLQKEWKESGVAPRKQSDAIWKRFRAACDLFFERKSAHFGSLDNKYEDNLAKKRELLSQIEAFDPTASGDGFKQLKEFQRLWQEIGFVPMKEKEALQKEYKQLVDAKFSVLRGNEKERKIDKYKERISTMKNSGNERQMRGEREKIQYKIKDLEAEITLLENNIGFFAKSKNAQSLIDDVNNKIAKAKNEIALLNDKIRIIDNQ